MLSAQDHARFRRLCDDAQRFVLVTHINPDGDALGSQIGLARFLADRGKDVRIVNHDATAPTLRFIEDPTHPVEVYRPDTHDALLAGCERVILVDNSAPDRLGRMEAVMRRSAGHTLCIDHHPSRETPWAGQILDDASSATAVLIYELVSERDWTPDRLAALAMYVGLATDTGFFRFNSTNARAHVVSAALLELGVEPARVYREICERNTEAYTRLLGHALVGLELSADGAIASVKVTRRLIEQLSAEDVDLSEIATSLLAIGGISVALLFRELDGGEVKVSLRSKGELDVHALASEFGGGGHRTASGIVPPGALDEVVQSVIDRTTQRLAGRSATGAE